MILSSSFVIAGLNSSNINWKYYQYQLVDYKSDVILMENLLGDLSRIKRKRIEKLLIHFIRNNFYIKDKKLNFNNSFK